MFFNNNVLIKKKKSGVLIIINKGILTAKNNSNNNFSTNLNEKKNAEEYTDKENKVRKSPSPQKCKLYIFK